MVEQWKQHLTLDRGYTVQQIIGRALTNQDFQNALVAVAITPSGGAVSPIKLGRWLKRVKGKVVNGIKLLQDGTKDGYPLWKLVRN